MAQFSRFNALDQILDIQGSFSQSSTRTLTDETSGFGSPLTGQTGAAATIATSGPIATITGLTGMTANSVGNFLTLSGAATGGNNGTFLIVTFNSASSVSISNATASAPDANDGSISWTERRAYSLNDDLDFVRTDRAAIKGVAYDQPIPVYQRPTAVGTNVPANLSNIAGKTTDAMGFVINRKFNNVTVAATNTEVTLNSVGNLRHSDATDHTGVPCFDAAPYTGDFQACYVEILDNNGDQIVANNGNKVFGLTNANATTSPDAVDVEFYQVAFGDNIENGTPYTWEAGKPTTVDMFYGYFLRLDQIPDNAFRTIQTLGLEENGDLRTDINDIQQVIGMSDGNTFLTGLTNTGSFFPFFNLPDGTPSVTEALNTLNAQIGNRDYTSPYLTDGQTITASLQALSNAVANSNVTRYIERLVADLNANTAHTLPGGATYVLDGTNNALHLWVFTRGLLRDPGPIVSGNDYSETSTTQVTFYAKQKAGDHLNFVVLG